MCGYSSEDKEIKIPTGHKMTLSVCTTYDQVWDGSSTSHSRESLLTGRAASISAGEDPRASAGLNQGLCD